MLTDAGGGTVTYSYHLNDTIVTVGPAPAGENPKSRNFEYDALGRLTSVCEYSLGGTWACGSQSYAPYLGFMTAYAYDPLGDLLSVNESGQTRAMTYDGLGRLTSETNPESGTKANYYDSITSAIWSGPRTSNGDLVATVDANNASTSYYYDALHRLTDVGSTGSNHCRRFRYDNSQGFSGTRPAGITINNSLGRLVEAATDTCAWPAVYISDEWFSYDANGRDTDYYQSSKNSGGWYHVQQGYWPNGLLNTLQAFMGTGTFTPVSRLFTYAPDGEGRPYTIKDGTGGSYILASTAYNTGSQPTQANLTGGAESFRYDPNSGRMTQWNSTAGSNSQTGNLTWNANGTLRTLQVSGQPNCSYVYDDLARLASVSCGSGNWGQNFAFDAIGNLSKSVPTGNTGVPFAPTYNSSNRITNLGVNYDAAGNTTHDNLGNSFTYDSEGRQMTVNGLAMTFDATNRTVEMQTGGSSYQQILYTASGQKFAMMNGATVQKYMVPLVAGIQAVFNSSGLHITVTPTGWARRALAALPRERAVRRWPTRPLARPTAETWHRRPLLYRTDPGRDCRGDGHLRFPVPPARIVAGTLAGARSRRPGRRRHHQPPDLEPLCLRGEQPAELR